MRILIDIIHPADVNFYKNAIEVLKKKNKITFTVLNRGNLVKIMEKEYPEFEKIVIGKHGKSLLSKIFRIIQRELGFFSLFLRRRFDVVTCFGFYPGLFAKLFGIKAVHFHDDKEYKKNFFLTRLFSSKFISLCKTNKSKKTTIIDSYKELAYLHPKYFKEDVSILKKMNLKSKKYVYVREIASVSLNYKDEKKMNYQSAFDFLTKKGYKIIYHPESISSYRDVINLNQPILFKEMIALKNHAALVITSGDTVLRECALLGVPVIYTSSRKMDINKELKKAGLFEISLNEKDLLLKTKKMLEKNNKSKALKLISSKKDINKVIIEELGR